MSATMFLVMGSGGYIDMPLDGEMLLSGPVPDLWSVPAFEPAPVVLPGTTWASIPARRADGTLAGLVDTNGQGKFVALDEATGGVRWQVDTGPLPEGLVRKDGWRVSEYAPAVPLTVAGDGVFLVAWARVWLLIGEGGSSQKTGAFPEAVPPVSAMGGACFVDGNFWIAIEDGRDGGITLSPAGALAGARSERPPTCLYAGEVARSGAISPLQNAHVVAVPVAADDAGQGYPQEVCGKYNKGSRTHIGREYCGSMRSDGAPEQAVMLKIGDPTFRDGDDWSVVRLPIAYDRGVEFHPAITGFELAFPRAFFDMVNYRNTTVENHPAPGSFEAKKVEQVTEVIEVVASIARSGELQWVRSVERGPMREVSSTFWHNIVQRRSLLLASHPDSPVKNLYVFKPGMLLAVDQATGAPRFQVGAALPWQAPANPGP